MMATPTRFAGYVVLTSKPGLYRTEASAGVEIMETYDYVFYGKTKAVFQIAGVAEDAKVRIVEDAPPHTANRVPTRVMERFGTLDEARRAIEQLANFGTLDATLVRR
ncbi:ferredoxin [Bordetella bronchialis]|nr:ferredoxin [Bordetella bronchialis]